MSEDRESNMVAVVSSLMGSPRMRANKRGIVDNDLSKKGNAAARITQECRICRVPNSDSAFLCSSGAVGVGTGVRSPPF